MTDDSMKEIYEKSKIMITDEERERRLLQSKIKKQALHNQGIYQYEICKIVRADIGDIFQFRDNLTLFSKEKPFSTDIYDDVRFIEPYVIFPNLVRFDLQIEHQNPFGLLGIVDVQLIEKITSKANIFIKTAGGLVQIFPEGYATKLYDDAVDYLFQLSEWLQAIYGKAFKQKDNNFRPGVPTKPGYDAAFKKIRLEGINIEEAYDFWMKNFPKEILKLEDPFKSFRDAMRYRMKKLKN